MACPFLPTPHEHAVRAVIMAWGVAWHGPRKAWAGLAWGGLTLADSFTLTQREEYLDSVECLSRISGAALAGMARTVDSAS